MQWVNRSNKKIKKNKSISMGYIILLFIIVIFVIRAVKVINNYRERGGSKPRGRYCNPNAKPAP